MVLRIIGAILLGMVALFVLWHVLGWLSMLFYLMATLVMFAAVGYGVLLLVRGPKKQKAPKPVKNFKLVNHLGSQIYVFRSEPDIKDLVNLSNDLHVAKLELAGDVFPVPEDTHVIVLEDTGKESIKIRIKGKKKKFDSEGWVERSNLMPDTKQISG